MIAENREKPDSSKIIKLLEDFIRQEVDINTLNNSKIADAFKQRLSIKAQDINIKYGLNMSADLCERYADEALDRVKQNAATRSNNDMRGRHRFGQINNA